MSWGLCSGCGYSKTGIRNGEICGPCAAGHQAPGVTAALAEMDRRSRERAAAEEETILRAYMERQVRGQRPDRPVSWQRAMAELRRRYEPR